MNRTLHALAAVTWLALTPLQVSAQASAAAARPAALPLTEATVRKVDKATGRVTLQHGELPNLDMPPMTMAFRVKDASWLDTLKAGDRLRVAVDRLDGNYTVIHMEPAP